MAKGQRHYILLRHKDNPEALQLINELVVLDTIYKRPATRWAEILIRDSADSRIAELRSRSQGKTL